MDWNKLRVFYQVARSGSVTLAAEKLNVSQPALSRSIIALEDRLKTKLFQRYARGLILTKQGEILFKHVKKMFEEAEKARTEIQEEETEPQGNLKIIATGGLVNHFIVQYIPEFLRRYPKIHLNIVASDNIPEFDIRGVDIAIRPQIHGQEGLIQRHLFTNHIRLYASPEYLKKYGTPKIPQDLDNHRLISFGSHDEARYFLPLNWHLTVEAPSDHVREPYIEVNTPHARLQLAEAGMGIAAISKEHPGIDQANLVEVLSDLPGPVVETYYIYSVQLKDSKRVKVFGDYLKESFAHNKKV
jgi:DNA-binding transcriptional LysR family regulator